MVIVRERADIAHIVERHASKYDGMQSKVVVLSIKKFKISEIPKVLKKKIRGIVGF